MSSWTGDVEACYDALAAHFHLIFENWEASMARQAAAIEAMLRRDLVGPDQLRLYDCACGIGTQLLGLAAKGYNMTGSDLSSAAVQRAKQEASSRGLQASLFVADLRDLSGVPGGDFDAVLCMDNSLPHLESNADLVQALTEIRKKLRPGGVLLASVRDYDLLVRERPIVHGPAFFSDDGRRRIVHQVWDWLDERTYVFHLFITRETEQGWEAFHHASRYWAVLRSELSAMAEKAGLVSTEWRFPEETGYYQPVLIARAPV